MQPSPYNALAYAKLNLAFEVLGRRADGYHEVKTVMQTIDLADRLAIEHWPALRVECDSPELSGESNLVWKAATALARSRGIQPRANIRVQKRIPIAMGLGGGSSDAAAALRAERHADADLLRPLLDRVRHQAVDADGGEQQRRARRAADREECRRAGHRSYAEGGKGGFPARRRRRTRGCHRGGGS